MRAIHNGDHCGDTYGRTGIKAKDGKLYVSAMFDCFDLAVLGLAMDTDMKAQLCVCTLRSAAAAHSVPGGVIVHSNRGFQYTRGAYRAAAERYGIRQSTTSDGGRCRGSARRESMWARMKSKRFYGRLDPERLTVEGLKSLIWRYFMSYRNCRIRSPNGGLPPAVKHRRYFAALGTAAQAVNIFEFLCQLILTKSQCQIEC